MNYLLHVGIFKRYLNKIKCHTVVRKLVNVITVEFSVDWILFINYDEGIYQYSFTL